MTDSNSTIIRSKSKKQKETEVWIEKDDFFRSGLRLDWKMVEAF